MLKVLPGGPGSPRPPESLMFWVVGVRESLLWSQEVRDKKKAGVKRQEGLAAVCEGLVDFPA